MWIKSRTHHCTSSGQSDSGSVVLQVAWVRVDTQTILSIHHNVITQNPRISLSYNDHRSWYLHIKNVHEADRGWYMCQVNTDPMRSRQGYLQVVGEYYIAYVTDWVINLNSVSKLDTLTCFSVVIWQVWWAEYKFTWQNDGFCPAKLQRNISFSISLAFHLFHNSVNFSILKSWSILRPSVAKLQQHVTSTWLPTTWNPMFIQTAYKTSVPPARKSQSLPIIKINHASFEVFIAEQLRIQFCGNTTHESRWMDT